MARNWETHPPSLALGSDSLTKEFFLNVKGLIFLKLQKIFKSIENEKSYFCDASLAKVPKLGRDSTHLTYEDRGKNRTENI